MNIGDRFKLKGGDGYYTVVACLRTNNGTPLYACQVEGHDQYLVAYVLDNKDIIPLEVYDDQEERNT